MSSDMTPRLYPEAETRIFPTSGRQEEESGSNHQGARNARDETASRRGLFDDDQHRNSGNPQHVHDAANKEKRHQHPAAPDAIETVHRAQPQRAEGFQADTAMPR